MYQIKLFSISVFVCLLFIPYSLLGEIDPQDDFGLNEYWKIVSPGSETPMLYKGLLACKNDKEWVVLDYLAEQGSNGLNYNAYINKTKDAGKTWDTVLVLKNRDKYNKFPNPNVFYCDNNIMVVEAGHDMANPLSTIWISANNGSTWDTTYINHAEDGLNFEPNQRPEVLFFNDSTFIVRFARAVFRTDDRFKTVDEISHSIPRGDTFSMRINDMYYNKHNNRLYALTSDYPNELKYSEDLGNNWESIYTALNSPEITEDLFFPNDSTCIIIGKTYIQEEKSVSDTIYISRDNFKNWEVLDFGIPGAEYISRMYDNDLYMIRDIGKFYKFNELSDSPGNIGTKLAEPPYVIMFSDFEVLWENRFICVDITYGNIWLYDETSAVTDDIVSFQSKVYPNPCRRDSKLFISIENNKQRNANCKVYNASGELINSQKINMQSGYHTIDYNTNSLRKGAYFLIIESGNEIIAREKFIVE